MNKWLRGTRNTNISPYSQDPKLLCHLAHAWILPLDFHFKQDGGEVGDWGRSGGGWKGRIREKTEMTMEVPRRILDLNNLLQYCQCFCICDENRLGLPLSQNIEDRNGYYWFSPLISWILRERIYSLFSFIAVSFFFFINPIHIQVFTNAHR